MNILSINSYFKPYVYPAYNQNPTGLSFCAKKQVEKDFFELSYEARAKRVYSKLDKLTKEEYMALTENEKEFLRSENRFLYEKGIAPLDRDIRIHNFAANAIQKTFDKQFGKDKYVVITVGRSLSSIGKALELKIGSDNVKNIPLSAVNEFYVAGDDFNRYERSIRSLTSLNGFDTFKQYLSSIGLDKKTIETSGKQYIIMDYAASGSSLAGAYTILTSNELLGNRKRNITTASIADITNLTGNPIHIALDQILNTCEFKKYSYVDKLYTKLEDVTTSADYTQFGKKIDIRLKKLFGFILLDQKYSGKKTITEDEITIQPITVTAPNQNAKIWNTMTKQIVIDTSEDVQEVFKIMHVLKEPLNEIRYSNKKLTQQKENLNSETRTLLENLFTNKFPLEYQYYKNVKLFEEKKDFIKKDLAEKYKPIFNNRIIEPTYTLFEKANTEFSVLKNENSFIEDEFSRITLDNVILQDLAKEIRRKYLVGKYNDSYYTEFRKELLEIVDKFAPKYTLEEGKKLTQTIKRTAIERLCTQEDLYEKFVTGIQERVNSTCNSPNQEKLARIVEQQNKILKEITY